ncbi:MAG: heat-inducible transcription repressor HrcA [Chthonomonas sp.]|nr:heat-inducible transcription repressor HrcA [Chthonomonas sp.]
MDELSPRKKMILGAVVVEYIDSTEPVASETVLNKYNLNVSSATVRNEFADLSELGYLAKPHTSAGRIPSDRGYRYFVDFMRQPQDVGADDHAKMRKVTRDGDVLQTVLRDTIRLLSRSTMLLSGATISRNTKIKVRHAVISALGPGSALLVLMLSNGHVENRMVELPAGTTLEQIGECNHLVSELVSGKTLREVMALKSAAPGVGPLATVLSQIRTIAKDLTKGALLTEGSEFLMGQPELQRDERLFPLLVQALQDDEGFYQQLGDSAHEVTIGSENADQRLQPFTIIRRSFFVGDDEAGTVAVVGPTRLNYNRNLSYVEFTARAISDMLNRIR